jgi:hypothetical protein
MDKFTEKAAYIVGFCGLNNAERLITAIATALRDAAGRPEAKHYRESGERCPKCGGRMILNHVGHECSEMKCDYIEPAPAQMPDEGEIEKLARIGAENEPSGAQWNTYQRAYKAGYRAALERLKK